MEKNRLPVAEYKTMTSEHYKEPVDGKYTDATAAILAGIGSELDTNEELSGLGQEQAQPTTTGSGMTPGVNRTGTDNNLDEEETDDRKGEGSDDSNGRGLAIRMKRVQITHTKRVQ